MVKADLENLINVEPAKLLPIVLVRKVLLVRCETETQLTCHLLRFIDLPYADPYQVAVIPFYKGVKS